VALQPARDGEVQPLPPQQGGGPHNHAHVAGTTGQTVIQYRGSARAHYSVVGVWYQAMDSHFSAQNILEKKKYLELNWLLKGTVSRDGNSNNSSRSVLPKSW
jgi:hypothetical protein